MKEILRKLLLGNISKMEYTKFNPIQQRVQNIKLIWNNDQQEDNGTEKIERLFPSPSLLFFPRIYIKYFASKKGSEYEDLALDFYVLRKVAKPLLILINHWLNKLFIIEVMIYLMLETVLYIPTLIFVSVLLTKPHSYKKSILLLFFNCIEMLLAFCIWYSCNNTLNKPFTR